MSIMFQGLKGKSDSDMKTIEWQMDPEQPAFDSVYHRRLTGLINEAIRNNYTAIPNKEVQGFTGKSL